MKKNMDAVEYSKEFPVNAICIVEMSNKELIMCVNALKTRREQYERELIEKRGIYPDELGAKSTFCGWYINELKSSIDHYKEIEEKLKKVIEQ